MSYCALIPFIEGKPTEEIEFRNAWGGAARIWTALFDQFLKDPAIPYHSWLSDKGESLWALAKRDYVPSYARAVHAFTFDLAYVRREHFPQLVADLREFVANYPVAGGVVDHLATWADAIEALGAEAVGHYGTSVAENVWWKYDSEEAEERIPVDLSEGIEVYEWLNEVDAEHAAGRAATNPRA